MTNFVYSDGGLSQTGIRERKDCVVRAFAHLCNDYTKAHKACEIFGREPRKGFHNTGAKAVKIGLTLGLKLKYVKRSGSLDKLIKTYPNHSLFVLIRRHALAITQSTIRDTFPVSLGCHVKEAWIVEKTCETLENTI